MTFIKRIAGAAAISAAMLVGLSVAQAGYVVDLTQQGGNVVASGSGEIDLAGLTGGYCCGEESFIRPNFGIIFTGSNAPVDIYYGLTGPSSFGSGPSSIFASSGSGDIVGAASGSELYVPDGYVTDSALSDTATYLGQTFSSLGVTPGRYEWAWGSGLNQNFMLVIGTPEPSTWTMMLLGFAGLGLVGYRRTRRGAAVTG